MTSEGFLDSNVIVYSMDIEEREKSRRAVQLIQSGLDNGVCCISRQVIQESINTAIRKFSYSVKEAHELLEETLLPLYQETSLSPLYRKTIDICFRYGYGFYDSMIIAAALELDCRILYTEDMQHGQQIDRLTIENPFRQ